MVKKGRCRPWLRAAAVAAVVTVNASVTAAAPPEERQAVIVAVLDDDGASPPHRGRLEAVLRDMDPATVVETVSTDAIIARLTPSEAEALAAHPLVSFVEPDRPMRLMLEDAVEIVRATSAWEIEIAGRPLTGLGQTIAVIDTGIDWSHPDLLAKNVVGCSVDCSVNNVDCFLVCDGSLDANGHGTHVAGIAAASGGISGIGVGANLIAVKSTIGVSQDSNTTRVLKSLTWCVDNHEAYRISVINLSYATDALFEGSCEFNTIIDVRVNQAAAAGIAVVIPTGNHGSTGSIAIPSCVENAIPVAATSKTDEVWSEGPGMAGSNYGPLVKLFAPGEDITSTAAGGGYAGGTGTSAAAGVVSGAIAVLRQLLDQLGVTMHPLEIEQVLFDTGDRVVGLPSDSWRRINVQRAAETLLDELGDATGSIGPSGE